MKSLIFVRNIIRLTCRKNEVFYFSTMPNKQLCNFTKPLNQKLTGKTNTCVESKIGPSGQNIQFYISLLDSFETDSFPLVEQKKTHIYITHIKFVIKEHE